MKKLKRHKNKLEAVKFEGQNGERKSMLRVSHTNIRMDPQPSMKGEKNNKLTSSFDLASLSTLWPGLQ